MTAQAPLVPVSREGVGKESTPDELPATVRALGWTSFLTDLSSEAIYPLLPAFVKGLGGTAVDIGLLDGVANAVAAIVRLFAGSLSDRVGRRPLVAGWGLFAVAYAGLALATSPWAAVPCMLVIAIAYGIAEPAERCGGGACRPAARDPRLAGMRSCRA